MVRFAIVGAGLAAEYHYEAIEANAARGARLAAVAHYAPERFEAISARFGGADCARYEDVLARADVDAVLLSTPSGQHAEQAVRAAAAGKHVLTEKPMALSRADADRMIGACQEAGVRLGVVFQRRALPLFQKIRRAVAAGDFGRLTLGSVTLPYHRDAAYYAQAPWRGTWDEDGGGVLMNQGIHLMDLLCWYLGDPAEVTARAGTLERGVEVEDTLAATLQFESGALATFTATTTARPGFPHRLQLYGTGGGVEIEGEAVRRWALADPDRAQVEPPAGAAHTAAEAGAGGAAAGIEAEGHVRLLADFIDAIRDERPPLVTGEEGRRSLAAALSVYEAAGLLRAPQPSRSAARPSA